PLARPGKSGPKPNCGDGLPRRQKGGRTMRKEIFSDETLSAQDIIDALTPEDERALMEWARLASANSIAAGGIGQTVQEMRKAREAWEALSPAAKRAHDALLALLAQEYEEAREEYR